MEKMLVLLMYIFKSLLLDCFKFILDNYYVGNYF